MLLSANRQQYKSFTHKWFLLESKEKAHSHDTITWNYIVYMYFVLYNLVIGNVSFFFNLKLQMKSEERQIQLGLHVHIYQPLLICLRKQPHVVEYSESCT